MPAAPAGTVETGVPPFVVLGPEALGLSTAPTDLHLLPDGRILLVAQRELAFGDGVRWEAFRAADDQQSVFAMVAVDNDGHIFTGVEGGIARVDLGEDARWRLSLATKLPPGSVGENTRLVWVAALPDQWYWYGSSAAVIAWRPGGTARVAGKVNAVERVFALGKTVYTSESSSGLLSRLNADGTAERVSSTEMLVSESVTCAIPFGPDELLVGTGSAGVKRFDGKTFRPFGPAGGVLHNGQRITDLCPTSDGFFAAAVDTLGIVFFDREGRTVQVLDRALDHRLGRAQRLRYAPNGVLWALLNEGVARVEFPSPVSHYESLLASGLTFAQPLRHAGQLWMLADGRSARGIYDASGRLERFVDDTPPGRYLYTLADVDGRLFAANEEGIYVFENAGWRMILPGIVNARLGVAPSTAEGIPYVARGEYGIIQPAGKNYAARRIPFPDLGDSYGSVVDAAGIGWLELGVSHLGRLEVRDGLPKLRLFGPADGLTDGWIELYLLDGIARFHAASHLYRFDHARQRLVEDTELIARLPQLATAGGRPVTDSFGRLWYTADGAVQVIDRSQAGGNRPVVIPPVGYAPTNITPQDDGVVWLFERRRLARVDLPLRPPPRAPLRALITSVQLSSRNRQLFAPGAALAPLDFADNSLVIHFAAPVNPFAAPVTFEVLLEGPGTQWVSTGIVGRAAFDHLKEGDYVFRVRPVAAGLTRGAEARLQFTVRPPWFRTPLAWALYAVAAVSLLAFVTWFSSYLQRRENERLERLVVARTGELNATNARLGRQIQETTEKSTALAASEERYRRLNTELEDRVKERTAKLAEASNLLDAMLENMPELIYFKDRESRFVRFSRAFATRFNVTDPELIRGKTDFDFFAAEHAQAAYDDERRIVESGEAIIGKLEKETYPDGHVTWALSTKMPWRDGTGRIIGSFGSSKDVTAWKEAETQLAATHKQLIETSRQAGMAEVATGVLHNVGNVLNSVNVSATLVAEQVGNSRLPRLAKVCELLRAHAADLGAFLQDDPKGRQLPAYLDALASQLAAEQRAAISELASLRKNVDHIKDIVSMQQSYARISGVVDAIRLTDLVEDALRMNASALARHDVALRRDYQAQPTIELEKQKVLQILVNLIANAKNACDESGRADKLITVRTTSDDRHARIAILDNGVGIPPENLTRIFSHGFTTRKDGHGFGLHSGALAAKELGGSLLVQSDGPGRGATFILELPLRVRSSAPPKPSQPPSPTP